MFRCRAAIKSRNPPARAKLFARASPRATLVFRSGRSSSGGKIGVAIVLERICPRKSYVVARLRDTKTLRQTAVERPVPFSSSRSGRSPIASRPK